MRDKEKGDVGQCALIWITTVAAGLREKKLGVKSALAREQAARHYALSSIYISLLLKHSN